MIYTTILQEKVGYLNGFEVVLSGHYSSVGIFYTSRFYKRTNP